MAQGPALTATRPLDVAWIFRLDRLVRRDMLTLGGQRSNAGSSTPSRSSGRIRADRQSVAAVLFVRFGIRAAAASEWLAA